ncbi:MAG TPA: tetratricopeptide repeat protein [Xanthobacteraceae bacterium]|nr:tetratricopeptide repeat protein [Xanthobacteraceae bacterium]
MNATDQQLLQQAMAALKAGALAEAERGFAAFLQRYPKHPAALNLYGTLLAHMARWSEAERALRRAIKAGAASDATFYNYGLVLKELGRPEDAHEAFSRAIALNPSVPETWNNRGTVLNDLRRFEEAIDDFKRAIALKPTYVEAHYNMGRSLAELRQYEQSLAAYDAALALNPNFINAWFNRGKTLLQLKRYDDALACYQKVLAAQPNNAEAWFDTGAINFQTKNYRESFAAYDRAFRLNPDMKFVAGRRLQTKLFICDWSNLAAEVEDLLVRLRAGRPAALPFDLLAVRCAAADQRRCAQIHRQEEIPPAAIRLSNAKPYPRDRLRLAYVSADFHSHATAVLIAELIELHDRSRFEILGVSLGPDDGSDMRRRLVQAFDRFVDAGGLSDLEAARTLHRLGADIAVDLKGYTQDSRPAIFAYRPAPIQVNYLGYPGTMGVDFIDYILADPVVLPFDQQPFYTERIVHLPDTYQVNDRKRPIAARTPTRQELGLPQHGFVFACFNNSYKITPEVFSVWMRLLAACDGAVLWLLRDNAAAETNLRSAAQGHGIDPARLVFADRRPLEQHLARHRAADLFLDTLPYNAHTTASDALWAGLPVLTCLGETFAGRVAASLLNAAGLPELVTTNLADYEALAQKLAREPQRLAAIKAKLAQNRETCALFDTPRFVRHIEAAYLRMWEIFQRGEPPCSFAVEAVKA